MCGLGSQQELIFKRGSDTKSLVSLFLSLFNIEPDYHQQLARAHGDDCRKLAPNSNQHEHVVMIAASWHQTATTSESRHIKIPVHWCIGTGAAQRLQNRAAAYPSVNWRGTLSAAHRQQLQLHSLYNNT
eukprot:COSAG01_NODE_482_length_16412_cov_47.760130_2_plen_129_part_00